MDRRGFLSTLTLSLLTVPLTASAQQAGRVYRIGFLALGGPDQDSAFWAPLREHLRERGWVEGQNLVLEGRFAEGHSERLPELAADLLRLEPDLLVTRGGPATLAAKRATVRIPILMRNTTDPVGIGAVASLARPGGNVTGLTDDAGPEIFGKRLEILKEVVPMVTGVANLTRVAPPDAAARLAGYETTYRAHAKALGLDLWIVRLQGPGDIDTAFAAILRDGVGGLDVSHVPAAWLHRRQILDLAVRHRLPAIYHHRQCALDGGLMAYGEDDREVPRRLAEYIDKLLRGARPADLPVEQPTKFELIINLKTAKALGLTIPPSVLARADEIIQ